MKKISLRLRLTLVMALLLSLLCLTFTLLVQHHMRSALVEPMYNIVASDIIPAPSLIESESAMPEPAQQTVPAMESTLAQGEHAFITGLWIIMGGTILLGMLLTYLVSNAALKPIKELSKVIEEVDEKTLACDLSRFQAGDEVRRLATSFDALLQRLRIAFERERRFSAYAAHELKTPLSVVKTALDIMDDEDYADPAVCRETMRTIGKQNDRMIDLSAQLLLLSRLQAKGKMQPVKVGALIEEIVDELRPLASEKEVQVHCSLSNKTVTADPMMLKHALSNLVENALRYNRAHGSVHIDLSDESLIISDTGIGIPAEDAAHIFEPFYRVDKSRSRSAGGTGLGLAITREIFEQCGTAVRYEPNEPVGSRFIVSFADKNV
jgi:signal transduction histidine kinase